MLGGCSGTRLTNPMVKQNGTFSVETLEMLQRPIEYTVKQGSQVNATASASWLFGIFPLTGGNVSLNAPIMGLGSSVANSEAEAISTILKKNPEADGLIVTQSIVYKTGIPGIYSSEEAVVKGRTLTFIDLGSLSATEWKDLRKLRYEPSSGDSKKKGWNLIP